MFQKIERYLLIVFDAFLGITAVLGGIGLLTGFMAPGPEMLQGSPFTNYTIPGLALLIIVGGSALLATFLLWRLPQIGVMAAGFTGIMILCFEAVEVLSIGSPSGPGQVMQIFYFVLGLLILMPSIHLWLQGNVIEWNKGQSITPKRAMP